MTKLNHADMIYDNMNFHFSRAMALAQQIPDELIIDFLNTSEYFRLMAKTVTIRMDEKSYKLLKNAAIAQKRSISNFIEYAAVNYAIEDNFVSDYEMADITSDATLMTDLKKALSDVKRRRFTDVK